MQAAHRFEKIGFDRFSLDSSTLGSSGAVALLLELDRGLRSSILGEQCEAVVWIGQLMQRHPEPSVVNTAFLKLADLFRHGHNFIRVCILRVFLACEACLPSVLNHESVVHRLASVLASTHTSARALALRCLGAMAPLLQFHLEFHQKLEALLLSPHRMEVDAAVYAADRLAPLSQEFAELLLPSVAARIVALETPPAVQLTMIPLLRHMHHTTALADAARETCLSVATTHPPEPFSVAATEAASALASKCPLHAPLELRRLADLAQDRSSGRGLQRAALAGVSRILAAHPTLPLPPCDLLALLATLKGRAFDRTGEETTMQVAALTCLLELKASPAHAHGPLSPEDYTSCERLLGGDDVQVAVAAARLMGAMSLAEEGGSDTEAARGTGLLDGLFQVGLPSFS